MKKGILEEEGLSDEEDQEYTQQDAEKDFVSSDYESTEEEEEEGGESSAEESSGDEASKKKRSKSIKGNKKKKRSRLSKFIEEEAEEESEEEEEAEEEEEDEITKQFLAPEGEEAEGAEAEEEVGPTASEYRKLFRERFEKEEIDIEAEEDRLRKLYGRVKLYRKRNKASLAAVGEEEEIPQQFLLPTPSDPKLWLVKCKIGKEKSIVYQLMRTFIDLQADSPMQIFSCIARDNLKGYIYVEAHKASEVARAVEAAHLIHMVYCGPNGNKCAFVPLEEMHQVLSISGKASANASYTIPRLGSFIRIKKGLYSGDLGQVVEVPEDEFIGENLRTVRIKVKLVPRLFSTVPGKRPDPKLFDPEEANQHHPVTRSRGFWIYERESYKNGLLLKDFYLSSIQVDSVIPKPKEVEMLGEEAHGGLSDKITSVLKKGDRVIVTEGEFINMIGNIKEITVEEPQISEAGAEENISVLPITWIKIQPQKKHDVEEIIVESKQICRYFTAGDRVVLMEEENTPTAIIISFSPSSKSLVVFNEDLGQIDVEMDKVSTEVSSGTAIKRDDKQSLKDLRKLANIPDSEDGSSQHMHTQSQRGRWSGPPLRSLLGKSVSIAYGPYKGYMGIVKQIEEQTGSAKVELHTNSKLVTVPRDRIIFKGAIEGGVPSGGDFKHPLKTPSWTPSASKTPAWTASKTPTWSAASGGKTPSWRDADGKTPAWRSSTSKTPSWEPQPVARQSAKTPTWQPAQQVSQPQPAPTQASSLAFKFISEGALVFFKDQGYSVSSTDTDYKAIVLENEAGGQTTIGDATLLKPQPPAKRDRAMIYGDGSMLKGTVIGLDGPEAVVKIDGSGEFKIIKASTLVKLK